MSEARPRALARADEVEALAGHLPAYGFKTAALAEIRAALSQEPPAAAPAQGERVYLVCTGEVVEGRETYTRHEGHPPPLCDAELLWSFPPAEGSQT